MEIWIAGLYIIQLDQEAINKNWGFRYKPPNIPRYPSSNSFELLPKII